MDLVIGDIHGCWEELQDLLQAAGPGPNDRIIAVGDLLDRGPAAREVLDFFEQTPNAHSVQGNHERKHIGGHEGRLRYALSQRIVRHELGGDYLRFIALARRLPLYLDTPAARIVHAFFEPGVPVEQQREVVLCGTMTGEQYLLERYDRPWYELYEGPPLIVGHRNYKGTGRPFVWKDRVYGIDTHCYAGRALTGLILPAFRFISVPSRRDYWSENQRRYDWMSARDAR